MNDEFDIDSDEKHELERLMKSLKNMELMVSLPIQDDELQSGKFLNCVLDQNTIRCTYMCKLVNYLPEKFSYLGIKTPALNRPPLPPKTQGNVPARSNYEPDEEDAGYLPGRSPRFIRKRDSLRDSARKNVVGIYYKLKVVALLKLFHTS